MMQIVTLELDMLVHNNSRYKIFYNTQNNYDKQYQQGKAAFNERNPNTTQQQKQAARSPGVPQTGYFN
jgi:hypothetical protein